MSIPLVLIFTPMSHATYVKHTAMWRNVLHKLLVCYFCQNALYFYLMYFIGKA